MLGEKPYLKGLVGTKPVVSNGALYDDFMNAWKLADPTIYYNAGHASVGDNMPVSITGGLPIWSPSLTLVFTSI